MSKIVFEISNTNNKYNGPNANSWFIIIIIIIIINVQYRDERILKQYTVIFLF